MNDLRNPLRLSLICRRKESSLSFSGSPVYERLSIPPQLKWWHAMWWTAHGGLTVCIHFHGTSSASLLSLYSSFVGLLGTGISTDQLFPYWHVLAYAPTHSPEMLVLIFFISWCRKKPNQEATFLDEEKKLVIWSPKELDYHLVLETSYCAHPILLHV